MAEATAWQKNNLWEMTAKDKDGKPVESAPGLTKFSLRGPESIHVVKQHAQQLLNAMRQRIFDNTGVDPGYVVADIKPVGHSEQTNENIGEWRPVGAEPVDTRKPAEEV